jgi:hypothetical protein
MVSAHALVVPLPGGWDSSWNLLQARLTTTAEDVSDK